MVANNAFTADFVVVAAAVLVTTDDDDNFDNNDIEHEEGGCFILSLYFYVPTQTQCSLRILQRSYTRSYTHTMSAMTSKAIHSLSILFPIK